MIYPWEAFEEQLHIRVQDKLEENSIMEWVLKDKETGKEYTVMILSMIGKYEHHDDWHCALIYDRDTDQLSVIRPK